MPEKTLPILSDTCMIMSPEWYSVERLCFPKRAPVSADMSGKIEDASVDLVIGQMAIQFVPDKPKALKEVMRVLKPGGLCIFK